MSSATAVTDLGDSRTGAFCMLQPRVVHQKQRLRASVSVVLPLVGLFLGYLELGQLPLFREFPWLFDLEKWGHLDHWIERAHFGCAVAAAIQGSRFAQTSHVVETLSWILAASFSLAHLRSLFKWEAHMMALDSWQTIFWAGPLHLPFSSIFGDLRLSQYTTWPIMSYPLDWWFNASRRASLLSALEKAARAAAQFQVLSETVRRQISTITGQMGPQIFIGWNGSG